MEEDVNSVKKNNYQSCRKKEKPGIRNLFSNGKKILFKIYDKIANNKRMFLYQMLNFLSL